MMTVSTVDRTKLKERARLIRKEILETTHRAGSGHPGGSLSAVEILVSLYDVKMKHRSDEPMWQKRDRLIVSKGHISPAVYVTLANFGYFPKEELATFRKLGSRLQGHVHTKVPGVEFSTGSLGHGLSVANGMAIGAKLKKQNHTLYCLMGDGEIQEGSVWEAAMTAAHHRLDNVCAIVDYNGVQENGPTEDIKSLKPLAEKWRTFGWHAIDVDGHNFEEILSALDECQVRENKPSVIIAHTVKGKGISFMEGKSQWHGKAPKAEQLAEALKELGF